MSLIKIRRQLTRTDSQRRSAQRLLHFGVNLSNRAMGTERWNGGTMSNNWKETSVRGDAGSLGTTSTHTMVNKETGEVREICVNSGSRDSESRQVGERLAQGDSKK